MITSIDPENCNDLATSKRKITIVPWDPSSEEKIQVIKRKIQLALGTRFPVVHRGSTSLGISCQNEIDVYIPVAVEEFGEVLPLMEGLFGVPRNVLPLEKVRFATKVEGKNIDLFLINKEGEAWLSGIRFEEYVKQHPEVLEEYRQLKELMNGFDAKEFYKRKTEFIERTLNKITTKRVT